METLNQEFNSGKMPKLMKAVSIAALCLTLSGCGAPSFDKTQRQQARLERQQAKVERLQQKQLQQSKDYDYVAKQQNIQVDLKNEGADHSINYEISESNERANRQDKRIHRIQKKLVRNQNKLLKQQENIGSTEAKSEKLKRGKYDYIEEERRRAAEQE